VLLHRRFPEVNISQPTLTRYYKSLRITYRKAKYQYIQKEMKKEKILEEQQEFAIKLVQLLCEKERVLYLDETSVNVWQYPQKVWQLRDHPISATISNKSHHSMTILGGISKEGEVVYTLSHNTSKDSFLEFLTQCDI